MRWKPDLDLTTNARVFTAVYLGALIMGPPGGLNFGRPVSGVMCMLVALLSIPAGAFTAGFIAGRDHGMRSALVALFISKSGFVAEVLFSRAVYGQLVDGVSILVAVSFLPVLFVLAVACAGEEASAKWRHARRLHDWPNWRRSGAFLLLLFVYSLTLGRHVAIQRIGYRNHSSYPVGVYIAVAREPIPGAPNNPTHYLDPTGLLVLGYFCIRI